MPRILVVDDDEVDRERARRCLESLESLEILFAADGEEALAAARKQPLDLVLTDLRMPGMSGLELVESLRDEHPGIPTILMTAQGNERTAVQALRSGAASYVPKDALKTDLLDTVVQVLEMRETRVSRGTVLKCLDRCEVQFSLRNDPGLIAPLAGYLEANLERMEFGTPQIRTQVGMALIEALSNAMIHGNLEVGSELRQNGTEAYYAAIRQRQQASPYAERHVRCTAREFPDQVEYVIADEGPGFDPSALPDPTHPDHAGRVAGRGLFLIRTFMDEVAFNDRGNEITIRKKAGGVRS